MKKNLLIGMMATVLSLSLVKITNAETINPDIAYKEAYQATIKASNYELDLNNPVEMQKVINEARTKIQVLKDNNIVKSAIPTFSAIVDKPQHRIFQLMIKTNTDINNSIKKAPIDYLYCNQEDINYIKGIITELHKTRPYYATTFSTLSDKPQQEKINRAVSNIKLAKETKFIGDILVARECIDDLKKIEASQTLIEYVKGLEKEVIELENLIPNKQIGEFNDEIRVSYASSNKAYVYTRDNVNMTNEWYEEPMIRNINEKGILAIPYGREHDLGVYKATYIKTSGTYLELKRLADGFVIKRIYADGKEEKFNPTVLSDEIIERFNNTTNFLQDGWYK